MKRFFLCGLLAVSPIVCAQTMEPGEWEFTTTTKSRLLPKPQTSNFKRCVHKEDTENPERWLGRQSEKNDCNLAKSENSGGMLKWEIHCPKTNIRGTGTAKLAPEQMSSDMQFVGELHGQKIQMNTRVEGRRLGPCAS